MRAKDPTSFLQSSVHNQETWQTPPVRRLTALESKVKKHGRVLYCMTLVVPLCLHSCSNGDMLLSIDQQIYIYQRGGGRGGGNH